MAEVKLSVSGQAQLAQLAARLKTAGEKGMTRELRREFRKAGQPALRAVREAARSIPVRGVRGGGGRQRAEWRRSRSKRGGGPTGLRDSVAKATVMETNLGGAGARIRFRTKASAMPPGQQKLPRYLDRPDGWRHPVFGNREHWVQQIGQPWFGTTLKQHAPKFRRACVQAIDDYAKRLGG
jgi:hypothetical protein